MKLMISKYPGTCRDCGQPVSRGARIAYHGRGRGVSCAKCASEAEDDYEAQGAGFTDAEDMEGGLPSRAMLESDGRLARRGLTVVRTSSGWSGTRNSRGRCEDAPCCGCCTA